MPRGRPNPLGQVSNRGCVHSVPDLEILEQDRSELDQPQGRFAPGDDGVHAGTVAVVGTDTAVAVAIERGGVAARATIALAGDQIDKRRFLGLLHISLSLSGAKSGWARDVGAWPSATLTNAGAGFCGSIRGDVQPAKRENRRVPRDGHLPVAMGPFRPGNRGPAPRPRGRSPGPGRRGRSRRGSSWSGTRRRRCPGRGRS